MFLGIIVQVRGGVEDTRLEAKAKDTKKIQGLEANFQGLEASRPRPRTSKCVLEDVLEDSTSGTSIVMFVCLLTVTYLLLLFFSHLSFCNCKRSTAKNCSEEAFRFGKRQTNK